jgi:hypothetical protein
MKIVHNDERPLSAGGCSSWSRGVLAQNKNQLFFVEQSILFNIASHFAACRNPMTVREIS